MMLKVLDTVDRRNRTTPWLEKSAKPNSESLSAYFREISGIPVLSRAEEIDLARKIDSWSADLNEALGRFPATIDILLARLEKAEKNGVDRTALVAGLADSQRASPRGLLRIDQHASWCVVNSDVAENSANGVISEPFRGMNDAENIEKCVAEIVKLRSSLTILSSHLGFQNDLCVKQYQRLGAEFSRLKLTPEFQEQLTRQVLPMFESAMGVELGHRLNSGIGSAYNSQSLDDEAKEFRIGGGNSASAKIAENRISGDTLAFQYRPFSPARLKKIRSDIEFRHNRLVRARAEFIAANLKLVTHIAKQYCNESLSIGDLIQEGNLGLLKAVDRYDFRKGFRFSTYASYWIKLSISRAIASQSRTVRLPFRRMDLIRHIHKVSFDLTQLNGRTATLNDIAQSLDISSASVEGAQILSQKTLSLDKSIGDDEDSNSMHASLEQTMFSPAFKTHASGQLHSLMNSMIETLNGKQAKVIRARFAIEGGQELTLQKVADEMELTRERVRQIQAEALDKLNKRFGSILRDFLD